MKILIADDSSTFRKMLKSKLELWNYDVIEASNGDQAWEILQDERHPRLALLDWVMPGKDGLQICRELVQQDQKKYIYKILLTSKSLEEDIVQGLEAGADDYLTKSCNDAELQARLLVGKRMIRLHEQMRDLATRDSLTGLWNHATIIEMLEKELSRAKRLGQSLTVSMADLDYFKQVNDTYGHLAGDAVLCEVCERIKRSIREYDYVGRYGGEEFLILIPDCNLLNAIKHAERILASIREKPVIYDKHQILLTMSIGITVSTPHDDATIKQLLQAADEALYQAKQNGRDRLEIVKQVQ